MKTLIKLYIPLILFLLVSCQDVIDVELQSGPERLVVEASLDWEKGTAGNRQTIRLTKSSAYFTTNSVEEVQGAQVTVTNTNTGDSFTFEDQNNGNYVATNFQPIIGNSYALRIEYGGQVYSATETMTSVAEIMDIFQTRDDGFSDTDLEVHVVFTDPEEEGNNYLFKFQKQGDLLPLFENAEDEFVNGNEIDWWFEIEEDEVDGLEPFQPGDVVSIEMYGISRAYYDYIKILIDQMDGAGLFSSTPVTVRGNCINETNPEDYAYGYFRLTEVNRTTYTFTED